MKARNAYCSFCRTSHEDVGPLVEGPGNVYICGECVPLCQSIIDQVRRRRNIAPAASRPSVGKMLDRLVTGQEYAKAVLAEAAFQRSEGKNRVLLIGPSPSGQTLLVRALAHALDVPFAAGNARGLLTTGNGNPLFELLAASVFDVESAQRGVVYVGGVEDPDAQDALMQLWHKNIIAPVDGVQIDVRGILFVCGGVFSGLNEVIGRLGRHPEQPVTIEALIAAGVWPELANCFAGIARVPPLGEDSLARILNWVDFDRVTEGAGRTDWIRNP